MADQIPYNPIPQVGSAGAAMSGVAPPAAFGSETAQALSHFGDVAQRSGDEIFARGIAMQQVNEQANANKAAADFTTELGKIHADFTSKLGSDAVNSFPAYQQAVNDLRQKYRGSLNSPYAQNLYDADSRNMQARAMWSASEWAGQQNRAYAIGASKAKIESLQATGITDGSADPGITKQITDEVDHQSALTGASPEVTALNKDRAVSGMFKQRITGLAVSDPYKAKQELDDAVAGGKLKGMDLAEASNAVQQHMYTRGASIAADAVVSGRDPIVGAGKVPTFRAQDAIGAASSQNNYSLIGPTGPAGAPLGRYQVPEAKLGMWLKEAGMPAMTRDQFIADHKAQDNLFNFKFGQYMNQTGSFNEAAKMWAGDDSPAGNQYVESARTALAKTMPATDLEAAARGAAKGLMPNDPVFEDTVGAHTLMLHNRNLMANREDEFDRRQTIQSAILGGGDKAPTSVDELTQDPKVKAAWNALTPSDRNRYMTVLAQNAKGDYRWTPETMSQYMQMQGIAQHPGASPDELKSVLNTDVSSLKMPLAAKRQLLETQSKIFKGFTVDPNTQHALQVLTPYLGDLKRPENKADLNQFIGGLHDVMKQSIEASGRTPSDQDIITIGNRLLQQVPEQRNYGLFGQQSVPRYKATVPDEYRRIFQTQYKASNNGVEPSDEIIHNQYIADTYQKFFGKKAP